jgi:Flp pilus assembly protein TadG
MIMLLRRMSKGQSSAELALALPFLVLLLVIVADFARLFYASIAVASAARAGVQYGAQSYIKAVDFTGMRQAALNDGQNISAFARPMESGAPSGSGLTATASNFCKCVTSPSATSACSCDNTVVACSSTVPTGCFLEAFVEVTTSATFPTIIAYPGVPDPIPLSSTAVMQVQSEQGS